MSENGAKEEGLFVYAGRRIKAASTGRLSQQYSYYLLDAGEDGMVNPNTAKEGPLVFPKLLIKGAVIGAVYRLSYERKADNHLSVWGGNRRYWVQYFDDPDVKKWSARDKAALVELSAQTKQAKANKEKLDEHVEAIREALRGMDLGQRRAFLAHVLAKWLI